MSAPPAVPVPDARPRSRRLWPALGVLTAATLWTVTAEMLPAGVLPSMSADLGVPPNSIGLMVSAWAITIAGVSIPLMRLTRRMPRTTLMAVALAATAVANLVTAAAPTFALALIGRILAASAHGLFWAVVVSFVAALVEPARLGRALAIVLAGPTLAGLGALPLAALLAGLLGWRVVFAAISVALFATAVAVWFLLPRDDAVSPTNSGGGWDRSALRVGAIAVAGGFVLVGHFAAFTFVTTLITGLGGMPRGAIPGMLLVLGLAGAAGVGVSGLASDRHPRAALPVTALLLEVGLGLVALGGHRPLPFGGGVALWGFAIGIFPPVLQARALRSATPHFRPVVGAVMVTVLNLGVAGGAMLGGAVLDRGPAVVALAALLAAALGTSGLAALSVSGARAR